MDSGTVRGGCLCGRVRFAIRLPTLFCAHCHCSMCRRAHGAGVVTWTAVRREQLTLESGEELLRRYRSSDHGTRSFCRICGSQLFCESARHPGQVDLTLASLDGPIDRAPQLHAYHADRVEWLELADGLPRLPAGVGEER
jgi:hypothetical protein